MTQAKYHREYYARNAAVIRANRRTRDKALRSAQRAYVSEHKAATGCRSCGIKNPIVLDLDHRDPTLKLDNVAGLVGKVSWQTLREEIAKCDVLCANCHRIKTHTPL